MRVYSSTASYSYCAAAGQYPDAAVRRLEQVFSGDFVFFAFVDLCWIPGPPWQRATGRFNVFANKEKTLSIYFPERTLCFHIPER